ncbi:unnamed protein product [Rodentolepis nana]|uniref:CYRIA-B_Rac1-bd domain-containing protein n=1 Tax=Rodentolepis nana TaxID=102285 RepID=A0A0R3U0B7_RODNA|nr:unnamed protein product [Rodentolepis nana]
MGISVGLPSAGHFSPSTVHPIPMPMANGARHFDDSKDDVDIFVDFENCRPSDEEYDLWVEINTKLSHTDDILEIVRNYPGAANQIRAAIEHYTDEAAQEAAWQALIPLVHQLRICYDFGVYLAQTVPRLLHALCSDELTVWEHLETQQALFKQFAEILDFIMQFDNLKSQPLVHVGIVICSPCRDMQCCRDAVVFMVN